MARNKLRRRGYSAVGKLIPMLSTDAAILISYKTNENKASIAELRDEIAEALKKAGVFKQSV